VDRNNKLLRMLFHRAGIDRAVLLGILSRFWSIVAGLITLLLVAYKFSPQLQGYYYTFFSIIAFQFILELGFGNNIIQFASHEWSKLSLDNKGKIIGDKESLSRLQSLAQAFFRWYYLASIILTSGLAVCGYLFFSKNNDANINWMLPWFSLCICNGILFCLLPIWSLLEGCNQILKLYIYRLVKAVLLSVSLWIAISLGAKLWAITISSIVIMVSASVFLMWKCRLFLKTLLFTAPSGSIINWRQEVLPLQWRTVIVYLVGPFSVNLFVPVLFKYHGSVIAGQMGMTMNLLSVVFAMPSSWINPKIPKFGILMASKKYRELGKLFWYTTKIYWVIAIVGAVIIWLAILVLNEIKNPLAKRFLPMLPITILMLAQLIVVIAVPFAIYLRAHKKEPLLFISVIGGILLSASTLILGKYYSAIGIAAGYFSIYSFLIPITFIIWYRCKMQWHRDEVSVEII